ncbi:hypothetical protein SAMN06295970_1585 [Noviherbaspirillum suwonense]|uniref:Uncharacterized protein n=1 Tax=Noviherbaspirillum suwonense TaxID=1224511 RepID=A0ABY1QVT8_9BURK|nr:hypothetical protein SAMN06295970_1585 [Noviherbaspirillum suwonense]
MFLSKSYEEWEAILVPCGIPVGAINNMEELVLTCAAQSPMRWRPPAMRTM